MAEISGLLLFVTAMISTVLLLALGLVVGYRIGIQVGARAVAIVPQTSSELLEQLQVCRETSQTIEQRSHVVSELSSANAAALPLDLQQAIDGLIASTKLLGRQLERIGSAASCTPLRRAETKPSGDTVEAGAAPATRPIADNEGSAAPSSEHLKLTGDEIHSLTSLAGKPSDQEGDIGKRRYAYDCLQTVHAWHDDGSSSTIGPGVVVRCHDIAVQGISFFWPDTPDFERLIISLGNREYPTYMAADVVQSKAVYMHGEVNFIVGCRFTGRVPEFSEQSRVQLNAKRGRVSASRDEQTVCT